MRSVVANSWVTAEVVAVSAVGVTSGVVACDSVAAVLFKTMKS